MSTGFAINRTMGAVEWGLLVSLSFIWGGSFVLNAVALAAMPPFTVVLIRVASAALALHLMVRAMGLSLAGGRGTWGAFIVMGAINNVIPFSLIVAGQTQIAAGLAAILNASTPFWTILVAHLFTADERMTGNRMLGVVLGFAGVVVMVGPTLLGGLGLNVLAQIAVVGAALSYGCAGVFGRRFRGQPPMVVATGQVTASTTMLIPIALLVDQPWTLAPPGVDVWLALAALGLVCTALAYIIFFRLLASAGATNLALVTLLVPVFAILFGVTLLGESLNWRQVGGMALIACGLAAIDGRLLRRISRTA